LLLCFSTLNAASSGKIAGYITDHKTGEPIPGANVMIEGHTFGAAADLSGYYALMNVPPGKYNLRVSVIGYSNVMIKDVFVQIDLTTSINVDLSIETVDMEEIVVTADRPVIRKDVSASELNVNAEM
jgi:hypothetical protein